MRQSIALNKKSGQQLNMVKKQSVQLTMSKKHSIISQKRGKTLSPHSSSHGNSKNSVNLQVGNRFGKNDVPKNFKKESPEKLKVTEKYNIEIDIDGNIACPAFPFPLIAFDDYEPDPMDRPWEEFKQKEKVEYDEVDPEKKGLMRWGKLTDIVLSQQEYPNIPLVKMGLRAKESDQYWKAIQRDYTIGKNITESLTRMRNVNEKHFFKGCPQDPKYKSRVARMILKKEQMQLQGLKMQNDKNRRNSVSKKSTIKHRSISARNPEFKNDLSPRSNKGQSDGPQFTKTDSPSLIKSEFGSEQEDSEAADRIMALKTSNNCSSVDLTEDENKKNMEGGSDSQSGVDRSVGSRQKSKHNKKGGLLRRMTFLQPGKVKRKKLDFGNRKTIKTVFEDKNCQSKGGTSDLDSQETISPLFRKRSNLITLDGMKKIQTASLPSHNLLFQRKQTKFQDAQDSTEPPSPDLTNMKSFEEKNAVNFQQIEDAFKEKAFVVPAFMSFNSKIDSPTELSTEKPSAQKLNLTAVQDSKWVRDEAFQSDQELPLPSKPRQCSEARIVTNLSRFQSLAKNSKNLSSMNTIKIDQELTNFCIGGEQPRIQRYKDAFHTLQANTTHPTPLARSNIVLVQSPMLSLSSKQLSPRTARNNNDFKNLQKSKLIMSSLNQSQYLSTVLSAAKKGAPNLSYAATVNNTPPETLDNKSPFSMIEESEKANTETAATEQTFDEQAARVSRIKRHLRERMNKVRNMKMILN